MLHPSYRRLVLPSLLSLLAGIAALPGMPDGWEQHWLGTNLGPMFHQAAVVTTWLALAWFGSRLFNVVVQCGDRPVPRLLGDIVTILLFGAAAALILGGIFHQPIGALLTTSGVVVAILGFSIRDAIGDLFAGICINLESPFRLGDWLELPDAGPPGKVVEINWRTTRMVTLDGITVVVPNGLLSRVRFNNYNTPQRHFRIQTSVVLDYDIPVEVARRMMKAAVNGAPLVLSQPAPDVLVDEFTTYGLRYHVRFWVADYEPMAQARDQVLTNIHRHLRLGGVPVHHARQDLTLTKARPPVEGDDRRLAVLRHIDLFRALTEDDLADLAEALTVRPIPHGTKVVTAGEAGSSLFVVVEGLLEVRGESGVLARLGPGEIFGEMSLLTGAPRSATVVTATDTHLFEIFDHQLRPILHRRPNLAEALGSIVEQRQRANRSLAAMNHDGCAPPPSQPLLFRIRDFFGLLR